MTKNIKFVGSDVHAASVAIAVAEMGGALLVQELQPVVGDCRP